MNVTVASHILPTQQGIRGLRHAKPPYRNGGSRFNRGAAFNDIVPHTYGTVPSGVLKDNRVWDTLASGLVTPDQVPGYPTTAGYDLTTGWGSPNAPGYVGQLVAHP